MDSLDPIATVPQTLDGLIIDGSRGRYAVETARGIFTCTIRGRLRKQLQYPSRAGGRRSVQSVTVHEHDPVAIGDRVRLLPTGQGAGVIEEVLARAGGAFSRGDPDAGGGTLTSIAGIEQMVLVFAARDPEPNPRLIDRFLVVAEAQHLDVTLCLNKVDLGLAPALAQRIDVYRALGYAVLPVSAATGEGLDALRARLGGRTSALLGPSGVGKSSVLNALQPGLAQRVSEVSGATHKGRHTTTGTRLFRLEGPLGGYLADTAGIRALAPEAAALAQLDWCFREFRPYLGACHFGDCQHLAEPECAVRAAVASGALDGERYVSYTRLRSSPASAEDEAV